MVDIGRKGDESIAVLLDKDLWPSRERPTWPGMWSHSITMATIWTHFTSSEWEGTIPGEM